MALFTDPVLRGALAGLLDELGRDQRLSEVFVARFLAPRRAATARVLDRAAERGEIEPGADSEWICDLVTGPLFLRAALPGLPALDESTVAQSVAAALAVLAPGDRGARPEGGRGVPGSSRPRDRSRQS